MNYGDIRVSTDKQTVENQRFEIENFCGSKGIKINCWIEETESGTIPVEKKQARNLNDETPKRRHSHLHRAFSIGEISFHGDDAS